MIKAFDSFEHLFKPLHFFVFITHFLLKVSDHLSFFKQLSIVLLLNIVKLLKFVQRSESVWQISLESEC